MASGIAEVDLGHLTLAQQEALQQYTEVTSQDIKDAVHLLQRSQWNVQIAIAKFFDGEGTDVVAEAQAAAANNPPQPNARFENLHESLHGLHRQSFRVPRAQRTELAPRVVPQPPTTYRPPIMLAVLFAPFTASYKVVTGLLRSVLHLLSLLPSSIRPRAVGAMRKGWKNTNGRRMLMPRDTAARFKREFEEEYGENSLPWFDGGHAQALDAAKKELKFLLTVLMSPEHDDTESFTRETLLAPQVVSFITDPANNIILWGGNVLDSEAYQVAAEYMCTKYPFSCLVCLTPKEGGTRMGIVKRLVGPMPPDTYLASIQAAMEKYVPDLDSVRAQRASHEISRSLRTEQDSAYERSLAQDRERRRQRQEAEAAAAAADKRAREDAEAAKLLQRQREQWRRWRAMVIPPEPEASLQNTVRLALNMPASSGAGRVIRRFANSTTFEELYAFVDCYEILKADATDGPAAAAAAEPTDYEHKYGFRIANIMPRETFEPDVNITLGEKLGRGGNLIVEELSSEDDS